MVSSNYLASNCLFTISSDYYDATNTVEITVVSPSYSSYFSSPTGNSTYARGANIPVLILTNNTVAQIMTVSFICANSSTTFNITTGSSYAFTPSDSSVGSCTFSVPNPPELTIAPIPVTVNIKGTVTIEIPISDPKQIITTGQTTPVSLSFIPALSGPVTSNVTLNCDFGQSLFQIFYVSSFNFSVPSDFTAGNCVFSVISTGYDSTNTVAVILSTLPSLSVTTPSNTTSVPYGQPVSLLVNTNQQDITKRLFSTLGQSQYTASFSCTTGTYQITGLITGVTYNIVPAGIYGNVVLTVTAINTNPSTLTFFIDNPSANIPPAFSPGRLPHYPTVYANMKNGKTLEILEVKYSESAHILN